MMQLLRNRQEKFDVVVVSTLIIIAAVIGGGGYLSDFHGATGVVFTGLIFGVPTGYLLARKPQNIKKTVLAGLLFGILFGFPFDFVATYTRAWTVNSHTILFPNFILGVVHLDEIIWFFLWAAFVVTVYEHFIEHDKKWRVSRHVTYALICGSVIALLVVSIFWADPALLKIPYSYAVSGLLAISPLWYLLFIHPKLWKKLAITSLVFIPVYSLFEFVALGNGWWWFGGEYIASISIGGILLPVEELIYWIILGAGTVAAYHELFLDDGR